MKRSKFREEQIIAILKEHELGTKAAGLCRKRGTDLLLGCDTHSALGRFPDKASAEIPLKIICV